jgi:hypothetical protein
MRFTAGAMDAEERFDIGRSHSQFKVHRLKPGLQTAKAVGA